MKKIIILLSGLFLMNIAVFAQYKNIQVNEQVVYQDDTLSGCYIVITNVVVTTVNDTLIKATYQISIYKSKSNFIKNPSWVIFPNEITIRESFFSPLFDDDFYIKVSTEFKNSILLINKLWISSNIIIEI